MGSHNTPLQPKFPVIPGYEILDTVGRGGMGVVYRARDLRLNREVAIKLLGDSYGCDEGATARFKAEAQITGQLQHPGIPAVYELGQTADGQPFLAMKLVRGRTLQDLLRERAPGEGQAEQAAGASASPVAGEPSDRARFIAIFEQICHAVGYAHAHGVIHRDLKPSNVMVGAFGEVQVMDWGLAKVLGVGRKEESVETQIDPMATLPLETSFDASDLADSVTRTGTVLGTPAYMPPEQAAGQIHQLDARSDVFSLGAILCEILTGKPPYEGKNVLDVRIQAVRGELQPALALLDQCGAEPELILLCKKCLAFHQEERPADGNMVAEAVAHIRHQAEERARLAELELAKAEVAAAEQAKRRRLTLIAACAVAAVLLAGLAVSLWQMNRAVVAERQARLLAQQAERNAAQARSERDAKDKALQAARIAREKAMAALRTLTDDIVEDLLARDDTVTEENKLLMQLIIKQFEELAATTGDDLDSRMIRAEGYLRVGRMRYGLGELTEAHSAYRKAVDILEQLVEQFPMHTQGHESLAMGLNNLGMLLSDVGHSEEAETAYRRAVDIYERLIQQFPDRTELRQGLATCHNNLAALLYDTGRVAEAEAEYRETITIYEQLVQQLPQRADLRTELATACMNVGTLLSQADRHTDAETILRRAVAVYELLVEEFPNRPKFREGLAACTNNLGVLLFKTGRFDEAIAAYYRAADMRRQLAVEFPKRPELHRQLATSYMNLANALGDIGRYAEASQLYRDAIAIYEQLMAAWPNRPDFREGCATSYMNLAGLLVDSGHYAEAEQAYRQAVAIEESLAKEFPDRPDYRSGLADIQMNLGNLLREMNRWDEAELLYDAALGIRKELLQQFPDQTELKLGIAKALINWAQLDNLRRRFPDAVEHLTGADAYLQTGGDASSVWLKTAVRQKLTAMVHALAGMHEREQAIREALKIRDLGWDPPVDAYLAACAVATCIPIVESDDTLQAELKEDIANFYAQHALELLQDASRKGFQSIDRLSTDRRLDSLRRRADFQDFLKQVRMGRK